MPVVSPKSISPRSWLRTVATSLVSSRSRKDRAPAQSRLRVSAWLNVAGVLLAALPILSMAGNGKVELPRFPSISPDGSEIVFSWGGDLWRASAQGGDARRLTRHEMDDLHSSWSPDGEWITFASMRDGYMNLWRMHREGTEITQLTHTDRFLRHPDYGQNQAGEPVITFSASLEADVYREDRPYMVSPEGGEHVRLHGAYGTTPQLSPNGDRVAFTRGGYYHDWNRRNYKGPDAMDVWVENRADGSFERITTYNGDDGSAQWQDDNTLVFMSDRELGTVNLYRVNLDSPAREFERLTGFEGHDLQHFDVSRDGSTAVLHVWDKLYTLDLQTPGAQPVALTLHANEDGIDDYTLRRIDRDVTEAALSPDGKVMAYIAYGRVYVRHVDDHSPTRAVTSGSHARHQSLVWSPDGMKLYFTNDADGTDSIYEAQVALTRDDIKVSYNGRPTESHEDQLLVAAVSASEQPQFEPSGEPRETEDSSEPDDPFAPVDPGMPVDPGLEPDPSAPAEPTGEPIADPDTIPESDLAPENQKVQRAKNDPARWHDAVQFTVKPVVQTKFNDRNVSPSPDGQSLAFSRGLGDLMVMDLASGETRRLVEGWDSTLHWRWSPDSCYIAYSQNDLDHSANIFIVPVDGSKAPVNITRHPRNDINPRWSADGRILTFISNRSGETYDLYRVYLDAAMDNYTARELSTYYRDARSAAAKIAPVSAKDSKKSAKASADKDVAAEWDLDDAWRRVTRVTASSSHQYANEMTPAGDKYIYNSGGQGLMVMDWDGSNKKRLGSTASVQHLNLKGDQAVLVSGGRASIVSTAGGKARRVDISDRIRIDLRKQSLQKFYEASRMIGENFYLSDMKGLDWPAVTEDYAQLVKRARTSSEFSDIANRLMGELAASHMGVNNPGPNSRLREPSGRLGFEFELLHLEDGLTAYRVTHVIPNGPANRGPMKLEAGDVITKIGLEPFTAQDSLLERLRGKVGEEVIVTFERQSGRRTFEHQALITPIDYNELARLKYDAFREESERIVSELSNGRLGYLHIQAMNQASLEKFQGDLYAAAYGKEGLLIDVRNNGGGNTTDRILTSIMAPQHAYTVPAGADRSNTGHYPQDRLDAPRYTLPINMLANEKSFSNAEILAHSFKLLGRGALVGQQTYGGVVSTGSHTLIDGATVRRPFRGWYLPDGTDMEHNGAMPDILVPQTPEDEIGGHDRQLKAAVDDMLKRLGGAGMAVSH